VQQPQKPLRIVTICHNTEKYISLLAQTQHDFYILPQTPWNHLIEQCPSNVHTLIHTSPPMDYIICYDRAEQYDRAVIIARQLHIPIIIVDMCSKQMIRSQHLLEQMNIIDLERLNRKAEVYIYNDQHIQQSWALDANGISLVIPLGIDIEKFKTQDPNRSGITLDNNTAPQVGSILAARINNSHAIIPTDHDNQTITVNTTKYFINTYKNITIKTLEAMAAENVVICLNTPDTSNYIEHQKTGWLLNDLNDLPNALAELEQNDELRIAIAQQARQKIISEHSLETFTSKWIKVLNIVKTVIYHPVA
jgi:glycosyltransferase involved in cell wall biosynthesis